MKAKILEILKNSGKALTIYEIKDFLGLEKVEEYKLLSDELRKLENEALIYHSNKDKYLLLEKSHLRKGIMRTNVKGYGFVEVDGMEEDIYINANSINGALHGDTVLVELTTRADIEKPEGRVLRILERKSTSYVGEINFNKDMGIVTLDDKKLNIIVQIDKEDAMNAVDGHKVVVELDKRVNNTTYRGRVTKIIGHKNDPGVDILSIINKYNIPTEFPEEVVEEVKDLPMEVLEEEYKGRVDLRNEEIFTIDGDDTKDIDDAISIEKLANGHYKLGVHIADVSHYVKEGAPLDKEALNRGTSVYLVDRVIPMLPHELSNGICSLNPNVDRLAISCVMEFDNRGKQVDYSIFESVINSKIQMTYKKVNDILENNNIAEGYSEHAGTLRLMKEFADILRKAKTDRGYIDFCVDEAKILVDENCVPTEVIKRDRGPGENLIEDFMIAANECVASHIYFMNLPFIYRIHELPKEEKIRAYLTFLDSLGYKPLKGNLKDLKPTTMQKLIEYLKDKPEFEILSNLLLRSMQKAIYSDQNLGHYGLASKCYTHFTSPIRRYPDLTVHRLLRTYLFNNKLDNNTINHWEERLGDIAAISSSAERRSVDCEREVEDMKMAEYMEQHIGEEFEGMISSVTNFGMFVMLDNLIEGLVPIKDMDDFYHYNEDTLTLTGDRTNKRYRLGDKVKVKVVRAVKEDKMIDFDIVGKV